MREQLGPLTADFVVLEKRYPVNGTPSVILPQDPTRWAIIWGNAQGLVGVTVSTLGDVVSGQGFQISTSSLPWVLTFRDVGALVSSAWYGVTASSPGFINVITIQYRPGGGTGQ